MENQNPKDLREEDSLQGFILSSFSIKSSISLTILVRRCNAYLIDAILPDRTTQKPIHLHTRETWMRSNEIRCMSATRLLRVPMLSFHLDMNKIGVLCKIQPPQSKSIKSIHSSQLRTRTPCNFIRVASH